MNNVVIMWGKKKQKVVDFKYISWSINCTSDIICTLKIRERVHCGALSIGAVIRFQQGPKFPTRF